MSVSYYRVYSDAVLQVIRETIEDQLGSDIIPEEYVFLRSVGRCLAIVSGLLCHISVALQFMLSGK